MIFSSRKEARAAGAHLYFTGKPCRAGHIAPRHASGTMCVECRRVKHNSRREINLARMKEYRESEANHGPLIRAATTWNRTNCDRRRAITAKYREANRTALRAANARRHAANPALTLAHVRARQLRQRRAMPKWADAKAIKAVYIEAQRLFKETGVKHSVDHHYPLAGKKVCGLHVHQNLEIMPLLDNKRKATRHPEDL